MTCLGTSLVNCRISRRSPTRIPLHQDLSLAAHIHSILSIASEVVIGRSRHLVYFYRSRGPRGTDLSLIAHVLFVNEVTRVSYQGNKSPQPSINASSTIPRAQHLVVITSTPGNDLRQLPENLMLHCRSSSIHVGGIRALNG